MPHSLDLLNLAGGFHASELTKHEFIVFLEPISERSSHHPLAGCL